MTHESTPSDTLKISREFPPRGDESRSSSASRSAREEWLELALEACKSCVWEYCIGSDRFSWSNSCSSLLERSLEDLPESYAQFLEQICPRQRETLARRWERAIQERGRFTLEYRWILPDAQKCWLEHQGTFIEEDRDRGARLVGKIEVLEREPEGETSQPVEPIPEATLQEHDRQELFNTFISASPVGIAIIDAQLRYLNLNETLAALNSKPLAEHIGKPIAEMIPPLVAPEIEKVCRQVLATGEPVLGIEATDEGYGIPGNIRTQLVSYFPLHQQASQSLLVGIVTYDITDRKKAEASLAASEARNRAFVEALPDMMFRLDRNGTFLDFVAPRSELLIPAEELIGSNVRNSLPESIAEQTLTYARQALATRQLECFEYQLPVRERIVDYEARCAAVNAEEVLVVVRNISDRKRAEAALAASEARNRAFIEAIPDLMFCIDRDGNYLDLIAPASEPMLLPIEELIGRNVRTLVPEFLADLTLAYTARALETRKLESFEYQLTIDGELLDYEARFSAVSSEEVMVISRNISDRKRAEADRDRLNQIIESTSDFVGNADLQGNALYLNGAWRRMLGLAPEQELAGLTVASSHPQWALDIVQEEGIPSAMRDGIWQGETAFLDVEGREIPVSQVIIVHRTEDGTPKSISTIVRDISNLKAAEVKLEEKAKLAAFRADVDAALTQEENISGMLSRCTEAAVRHLNAAFARIWTLNPEDRVLELQASSGLYTHLDGSHGRIPLGQYKIGKIAERGEPYLTNDVFNDPFVDREWAEREGLVAFAGYPLMVEGSAIGVIALFSRQELPETTIEALNIASDEIVIGLRRRQAEDALRQRTQELERTLSELQRTQAQLIQTEKMSSLGQMVAGIAHEINNPINFIHGNISHAKIYIGGLIELVKLYRKTYSNPTPEIEEKIEEIELDFAMHDLWKLLASMRVGSDRIRKIVLSLRNFSRLDESAMKPVNLHEGIDSTLLVLQHRLRNIQVQRNYGTLPLVECYAGQFNQVLLNILSNAIEALETDSNWDKRESETTACIKITTERLSEEWVAVSIADNGPGMPETVRQKLFDPFFTTKPVGMGTGLGLSISYQIIVDKHRGKLDCISAPEQGATLKIEIPIHQPKMA
ncbi:PAS domain S-box protein [Oscillatoria sp. FACHB-1406]|uniref:PAS domain S-box protein n=1 Tax=Oscillatoria sp. FACHB-1406 TaxID=2692846 RepID=UPI001688EF3D|nr:PAS domain S-box protein [Oscillatoria sp. FACHB-1406]MBD2579397.1 PAS domain S-box protein [Oscillatoria sp. FACHB-1406]